ncbi:MAG: hypothetical protein KKF57_01000 [Firmicutes bacterium]|nr:hypothetical protein [Bacillota bacterium]
MYKHDFKNRRSRILLYLFLMFILQAMVGNELEWKTVCNPSAPVSASLR